MIREQAGTGDPATTRVVATHAVPDKSIIDLAYDLSNLDATNIWPSQAEVVRPEGPVGDGFVQSSVVDWMEHGCHACIVPLDGRDGDQINWMVAMFQSVASEMMVRRATPQNDSGEVKVGIVWKRADGQDSDAILARSRNTTGSSSATSMRGVQHVWPRAVVHVGSAMPGGAGNDEVDMARENINHSLQFLIDPKRKRIRDDCVVSLVMYDESNCVLAMLHVVVARTRTSFSNVVSLIEEIGALHSKGKAGDYPLKTAHFSPLNMIAAPIVGGNTKLFVAPCGTDMGFVSKILSVCSSSQTLRTDIQWCDASSVPLLPVTGSAEQSVQTPGSDWITVDVDGQSFHSPAIESMRESLKLRSSQTLNEAAKSAMKRLTREESPTLMAQVGQAEQPDVMPEKRTLEFPSLRSSWNSNGLRNPLGRSLFGGSFPRAPWKPTREVPPASHISRDVFSTVPSTGDDRQEAPKASISINNDTDSMESDVPEFVESEYVVEASPTKEDIQGDTEAAISQHAHQECGDVREHVRSEIERKVNEKLLETIRELERKLEWSEIQRFQLESSNQSPEDAIVPDVECKDAESMLKALREERRLSKKKDRDVASVRHDMLALEVELATKDTELGLLRARVKSLQSQSDLSVAFQLCEDALESSQEEARRLRCENKNLSQQLMTLQVSNMLASYAPILPHDEAYDVNGAEGRIIYELSEKVKAVQQQLAKVEQQKEEQMQQLEQCQRHARSVHVNKKVAQDALRRASYLQKELDTIKDQAHRQELVMYEEQIRQQHSTATQLQ